MASSTSSETSPKRRRVSQELLHDEDLWLEDGNIVIAATDETQEEKAVYAFKCHRSVLSEKSEIFADMFSLPPSDVNQTIEGVPRVHLEDPVDDLRAFLQMLYDGT